MERSSSEGSWTVCVFVCAAGGAVCVLVCVWLWPSVCVCVCVAVCVRKRGRRCAPYLSLSVEVFQKGLAELVRQCVFLCEVLRLWRGMRERRGDVSVRRRRVGESARVREREKKRELQTKPFCMMCVGVCVCVCLGVRVSPFLSLSLSRCRSRSARQVRFSRARRWWRCTAAAATECG